ncbi:hypothetical protein JCM3766R1_004599 [Sporobolomyces carnicolor]
MSQQTQSEASKDTGSDRTLPDPVKASEADAADHGLTSSTSSTASPPASPSRPQSNPALAPLRALFPSTSDDILEAVLDAHAGDLQAATESLLDLNNPDFKSDPTQQEELEQIDLDAELARQLAEEDERQYRRERAGPREPTQQPSQPVPVTYQAYVPKNRRRATVDNAQQGHGSWQPPSTSQANEGQQRQQQQQADDRDELDMLAENFSKFAEQGKKSFGSFMSKVKEQVGKLDDMIQQSASPSTFADRPPQPPPKPSTSNFGSARTGAQWTAPEPLPRPADAPPRTTSLIRPRDTLSRQDTNDSFTIGDDTDHSPNPSPGAGVARQPSPPGESIDSYFKDFDRKGPRDDIPIKINRNETSSLSASSASLPAASATAAAGSSEAGAKTEDPKSDETQSQTGGSTPAATVAPAAKDPRKDFSKIGLLPRRSVSLLDDDKLHRSSPSSSNDRIKSPLAHPSEKKVEDDDDDDKRRGNESDDSDELEYVKNPFDEE